MRLTLFRPELLRRLAASIPSVAGLAAALTRRRSLALRPGLATGLPLSRMMTQQALSCEALLAACVFQMTRRDRGQEKKSFAVNACAFTESRPRF
jgi:hypothetical protein